MLNMLVNMPLHDKLMLLFVCLSLLAALLITGIDVLNGHYSLQSFPFITGISAGGIGYTLLAKLNRMKKG